jgi:hypothetical protein
VSTSPEIVRTLMAGEQDDESGEGARRVCPAVAGFAERHPDAIADVEIARHRPMSRDASLRELQACRAHDVSDRLERIPGAGSRLRGHRTHPRGRARRGSSTAT